MKPCSSFKKFFLKSAGILVLLVVLPACQSLSSLKKGGEVLASQAEEGVEQKLKLGLFISDGGGEGTFTLIPVLKFLQENQVHFDSIAGTGWGAWLGAVFAKSQNINQAEWALFKLRQKGVFADKLFTQKKTQALTLSRVSGEFFNTPLATDFNCPVLNSRGELKFVGGFLVLRCLNALPPLNFIFPGIPDLGSVFSARETLDHLKLKGMDLIVWLKGPVECVLKGQRFRDKELSYWLELVYQLNHLQKGPEVFVFDMSRLSSAVCGFLTSDARQETDSEFHTRLKEEFKKLEHKLKHLKDQKFSPL